MLAIMRDIIDTSMEGPTPYVILMVVVFFVFVEQWVLFSLLSPGSWGIIVVSFMAFSGAVSIPLMLVAMFVSSFAGTQLQYYVGQQHGERFLRLVNRFPQLVDLEQIYETKVNTTVIVLSYSLPQIRGIMPFLAGASDIPKWKWYVASMVGLAIWLASFVVMGMGAAHAFDGDLHKALDWVWAFNTRGVWPILLWTTTIIICVYYIRKWRRRT